jgi:hypothetical protein
MYRNRQYLFYAIKLYRITKGLKLYNVQVMTDAMKDYWQEVVVERLEDDPELNNNLDIDSNKLEEMLLLNYFLKIMKLVIIILNLSYLFGVFWMCLCEAVLDFQFDIDIETYVNNDFDEEPDLFLNYFQMYKLSEYEALIIATYFAFTSLSTVGLGDFHPRGNIERVCTGFMLLFGVAIFSYIMGNFIEILSEFKEFHKEIDDGDNLSRFFGTLKYFNGQRDIELKFKESLEIHFQHRWKMDKRVAFIEEEDISINN